MVLKMVLAVAGCSALGLALVAVVLLQHRFAARLLDRGLTPKETARLVQAASRSPLVWNSSQSPRVDE